MARTPLPELPRLPSRSGGSGGRLRAPPAGRPARRAAGRGSGREAAGGARGKPLAAGAATGPARAGSGPRRPRPGLSRADTPQELRAEIHAGLTAGAAAAQQELRERMLSDGDALVRLSALSRTPGVDPATAEDLEPRHRMLKVRDRPADHVRFPPGTLRRFATDPDARIRVLALRDPQLPPQLLERLAADEEVSVRRDTAGHPQLPQAVLVRLLGSRRRCWCGC